MKVMCFSVFNHSGWLSNGLLKLSVFSLFMVVLTGCAGKPYTLDYRSDTQFDALKRFAIQAPVSANGTDSLNDQRTRDALQVSLGARGYVLAEKTEADFLATWRFVQVSELNREGASFGVGYGFGLGSGSGVGVSMGTQPPVKETLRQKLVVDMLNPSSGEVFWTAEARQPLSEKADPGEREAELRELITEMLQDFPPRP